MASVSDGPAGYESIPSLPFSASSLLRHGPQHMRTIVNGLSALLTARGIESVSDIRGRMSQQHVKDPAAVERANYIHIFQGYHAAHTSSVAFQ